jgi:hypothetical protein
MYSSNARATAHNWDVMLNSNTESVMFNNMSELRAKNKQLGHQFFSREMMRQFNSKVETALFRGRWFIMSDKGREQTAKRKYKLWEARSSGEIVSAGDAAGYNDIDTAKQALKAIIRQSKR